jgi:hypothetical protein
MGPRIAEFPSFPELPLVEPAGPSSFYDLRQRVLRDAANVQLLFLEHGYHLRICVVPSRERRYPAPDSLPAFPVSWALWYVNLRWFGRGWIGG